MRNAIYSGILGLLVGILIGVYGIAPDTEEVVAGSEKEGTFRESDIKELVASAERKQKIVVGTSNLDSPYFAAGAGICRFLKRGIEKHGITCLVENTSGSADNINNILRADGAGRLTMGVAQSRWLNHAFSDGKEFQGRPQNDELRAVFTMHPEPLTVVARAGSGIKPIMDLKGKRVNIGNPGSGQRGNAMDVLRSYGLDRKKDIKSEGLQQGQASRALVDKKIDAFFYTVGNPWGGALEIANSTDLRIIPIDSDGIKGLVKKNPYYVMTVIPGGIYKGVPKDVPTYAVKATFVTSSKQDPVVVYDLVKTIFENLDKFRASHAAFKFLTPKAMLGGLSAPFHKGAVRYYKEKGLK